MIAELVAPADGSQSKVTTIDNELAQLQDQVTRERVHLASLRQEVLVAEKNLEEIENAKLVKTNERLACNERQAQKQADNSPAGESAVSVVSQQSKTDASTKWQQSKPLDLMLECFAQANEAVNSNDARLALLCLGITNLRHINSTFGHAVGNLAIEQVLNILKELIREGDTAHQQSGDEFILLLTEVSQPADTLLVANRITEALGVPMRVGEHVLHLETSIGIQIYPDDGDDALTLIHKACTAMRQAPGFIPTKNIIHDESPWDEMTLHKSTPLAGQQSSLALTEHERRYARLREANGKLVLAALSAQELQAAAEQAKAKQTQFLGVLAHELRHPLAPIRNAAAILAKIPLNEPRLAQLQGIIDRQVEHMSRLVSDLLDISRVDNGKLRLEREIIDMTEVIHEAIDTCRPALETRMQSFNIQAPQCAIKVDGDPVRLAQILSNLLDNASKYTPTGGVIGLTVWVEGNALVMTVSDSGIGITAEALPHVFEPFVQDIHATTFDGSGLGIGLTVVRELVEAHGGSVVASSGGSGLGSQFIVTLALHEPPPMAAAESLC